MCIYVYLSTILTCVRYPYVRWSVPVGGTHSCVGVYMWEVPTCATCARYPFMCRSVPVGGTHVCYLWEVPICV